jgi:UDP-glucose 4-epimerase
LLEVIEILERIIGQSLQVTHRDDRVGDVRHSQADNSVLQKLFPSINPVSLEDGLRATVEWLQNYLGVE